MALSPKHEHLPRKMNKLKIICIVLFLIPSYVFGALTDDLVSYWPMDEESGARYDATASDNDLTDNNTVLYATGIIDNGADFEASNSEWLSILHASMTGLDVTPPVTISLWWKPESTGTQALMSKKTNGDHSLFNLFYENDAGTRFIIDQYDNSNSAHRMKATYSASADTWYHVVVVATSTDTGVMYVNGTQLTLAETDIADPWNENSTSAFGIGSTNDTGSQYTDGIIDEVGIWSVELTEEQILSLYAEGVGCTYPFTSCEGEGETATSTATSSLPYTYDDWLFVENMKIFFLGLIGMGMLFSVFRQKRQ